MVSGHTEQQIRDHCLTPERADAMHNRLVDRLTADGEPESEVFDQGQILAPPMSNRDEPATIPP